MIDKIHKYVVTVRHDDGETLSTYCVEMYSAADAVEAVRAWLLGRYQNYDVTRVEPYNETLHGQWFVTPGGPGRGQT